MFKAQVQKKISYLGLFLLLELEGLLRLGQHIQAPGAKAAIGRNADQIVCVGCAYYSHAKNGVCMSTGREWASLHRRSLLHSVVPYYHLWGRKEDPMNPSIYQKCDNLLYLSAVSATNDEMWMELGECGHRDWGLTMECLFRGVLLKAGVPYQTNTIGIVS